MGKGEFTQLQKRMGHGVQGAWDIQTGPFDVLETQFGFCNVLQGTSKNTGMARASLVFTRGFKAFIGINASSSVHINAILCDLTGTIVPPDKMIRR